MYGEILVECREDHKVVLHLQKYRNQNNCPELHLCPPLGSTDRGSRVPFGWSSRSSFSALLNPSVVEIAEIVLYG